jgi:hypothetical protein
MLWNITVHIRVLQVKLFLQAVLQTWDLGRLYDPGIRDGYKIRIQIPLDEKPVSYFRDLKKQLFGLKYLNSLMRIRDGKNTDPG